MLHQHSAVAAVLRCEEELTILFTSTNGLAQSPFAAGSSISISENLMECSQTLPLYPYRGRDARGQQVRSSSGELLDLSSSFSLNSCPAPLWGAAIPVTPAEPHQWVPGTPQDIPCSSALCFQASTPSFHYSGELPAHKPARQVG